MWNSYHVVFYNGLMHDDILVNIAEYLNKTKKIFFFIRYWEGGPHLRIRIKDDDHEKDALLNIINRYCEHSLKLDKKRYYENNKLDGEYIPIDQLPWFNDMSVLEIPYIRENDRYGGEKWIDKAEDNFVLSSKFILDLLPLKMDIQGKLVIHLLSELYILKTIEEKVESFEPVLFLENCIAYWKSTYGIDQDTFYIKIIEHYTKQIDKIDKTSIQKVLNDNSKSDLDNYCDGLMNVFNQILLDKNLKLARSVLFSQFHMTANRMGIPIELECCIYEILKHKFKKEVL